MQVKGLHLLLTYKCNSRCDHCFVWGCSEASGVMTLSDISRILDQAREIPGVEKIFFEGGEPFLYYPIMVKGVSEAKSLGFNVGIVTNAYWATTVADALAWLSPLQEAGLDDLSVSDDALHYDEGSEMGTNALDAAQQLGLAASNISTADPVEFIEKGRQATGGAVMFKGRAAVNLTKGLPTRDWQELDRCPYENFEDQRRVHLDPFGLVHVCQGIVIGDCTRESLSEILSGFDPAGHPICGPIVAGGPAELVRAHGVDHRQGYVDECHLCYEARQSLRAQFPQYLGPDQAYGAGLRG